MESPAKHLIGHYQKTYELTYDLWRARNQTFLILLAAIAAATLISFPALGTRSLFFLYLKHLLDIDESKMQQIQSGFPFGILQAVCLFVIFYLTVNLYHRARYVLRNYAYLGALEAEIRSSLDLAPTAIAFTRESTFYWGKQDRLSGSVKWAYIVLLSALLISFLVGTIVTDGKNGNVRLMIVDLFFAVPIMLYLAAFAMASVSMGRKGAVVPAKASDQKSGQASGDEAGAVSAIRG